MSRISAIVLCSLVTFSLVGQRAYQIPKGISVEQVDQQYIIVKMKGGTTLTPRSGDTLLPFHKKKSNKPSVLDGMCKIRIPHGDDPIKAINAYLRDPNVLYAEPFLSYEPLYTPSDPDNTTNQGYLDQISAYDAWEITRGDDDITIGILDTGLDLDHVDLETSIWTNDNDPIDGIDNDENGYIDDFFGFDFSDVDNDPTADGSTHGVRVGGIAGASTDNASGISGVGFNTKIAALKGFTTVGTSSTNIFEGIVYAADNGIQIVNLSFGSLRDPLQSEQDIIDYAVLEKDVALFAAAGNTDVDGKFYPASYDHVISVGAVDGFDNRWSLSTYNYSVDLMAPGTSIYSTENDDDYGTDFGTSYASPMAAGTAALVRAVFPTLNAQQVMERVRVTTNDIYDIGSNSTYDGKLGSGRLNVFNAVTQSNVKSLRAIEFDAQTSIGSSLFFGDTVTVTAHLTNFLSRLDDLQITISSPDNYFATTTANLFPGSMNTLEEDSITFDIILDADLAPESPIAIRLDYLDGAYSDFQFLEATSSADHSDFGSNLQMTIAGNGNLGFAKAPFNEGIGITNGQDPILTYVGLMMANSASTVSDNVVSNYATDGRDQDFGSVTNYKLLHHPAADHFAYSEFEDAAKDLIIEQSAFSWEDENFILLRYRIVNTSSTTLTDLSVGLFADFDLSNPLENRAEYDVANSYIFTKDVDETVFAGSKVISAGAERYSALDMDDQNGNASDVNDVFSDATKFDFLENQLITTAGDLGNGNDVATLNGTKISQIDSAESDFVTIVLAAANSKAELESVFSAAETRLNEIIQNPPILETTFSCEGSQVTLDPESGTNFRFYEDAAGTTLITEGSSYLTGIINSDTTFYIRNIDGSYPSDLFQYRVELIDEVADFVMNPDTLYLDGGSNVVSFVDNSFEASLWNWDFGEGTTSTVQDPQLTFNLVGNYDISLYVENIAGCTDTKVQTLVVANRPASPTFDTFTVCPGDSITLSDPTADRLEVFENASGGNPLYQGNDLKVGPFVQDSTIYVSGIYSQFESLRVPVTIDVDEVLADFTIEIDTIASNNQIIATSLNTQDQLRWFVNEVAQGTSGEITIDSNTPSAAIRLEVENANGCVVSIEKDFEFSSSPIPSQSDVIFCSNEIPIITPQNGDIFGFYEDEALTTLIKKGTELEVTEESQVFVVGLDDGLPSSPREVNITFDSFNLEIVNSVEVVADKNKVSLSASLSEDLMDYQWFVDGVLLETIASPTLFLDDSIFEIVLQATNENGCTQRDTLNLDFTPPLSVDGVGNFFAYPNPTPGIIHLTIGERVTELSVWDLAGKVNHVKLQDLDEEVDLSILAPGIYLLKAQTASSLYQQKLVIKE